MSPTPTSSPNTPTCASSISAALRRLGRSSKRAGFPPPTISSRSWSSPRLNNGLASAKPSFLQPFEHMVAGLLCAELSGEPLGAEEWRHTHYRGPLSLRVLSSIQLGVAGRQDSPSHELRVASEIAGEAAVHGFDALAIPAEEIVDAAELKCRSRIGAIKAKRAFKPGQGVRRSTRPHQDAAPR